MSRYEFAEALKGAGLTAYEYGSEEYQEDLASIDES
jgi:predicted HTH domain antitoxin